MARHFSAYLMTTPGIIDFQKNGEKTVLRLPLGFSDRTTA